MADDGGAPGRARGVGLQCDGFLETGQLVVGQDAEEALQQDHGFAEAGIEVEVVVIESSPETIAGLFGCRGHILRGFAKLDSHVANHVFQGGDFGKELRTLGEHYGTEERTAVRRALPVAAAKVGGIERLDAGHHAVMLGVFVKRSQQTLETLGQTRAERRNDIHNLEGFAKFSGAAQAQGFIQRNAEHDVTGFEFACIHLERLHFGFGKPTAPIRLDRDTGNETELGTFQALLPKETRAGAYHETRTRERRHRSRDSKIRGFYAVNQAIKRLSGESRPSGARDERPKLSLTSIAADHDFKRFKPPALCPLAKRTCTP
jgi:hypothetical protein